MIQKPIIFSFFFSFISFFSLNTFRLWVPQLFTIITEYENDNNPINISKTEASLCDMLAYKVNKTDYSMNKIDSEFNIENIVCEPVSKT
jgi:hypothetical protein